MIVLMVSESEAQSLVVGMPSRALKAYVLRELQLERLLPDDNLPVAVLLHGLDLSDDSRHYVAAVRTYATEAAADRAWDDV